jgi:hypothetical protein
MIFRVASAAAPVDTSVRTFDYDWPMSGRGQEWVKLRIPMGYGFLNGAADAMEKKVYPNGRPKSSAVVEELLLSALWPDMALHTMENNSEFQVPGGGRMMDLFMRSGAIEDVDGKHYNRLQNSLEVRIEDSRHVCIAPAILFNEDGTRNQALCHDRAWPDEKPTRFGLKHMGVDFSKYPDFPKGDYRLMDDLYYAPDLGRPVQTVITCTAEELDAVESGPIRLIPQCRHLFIFKPLNAWVSIRYRRVYLKDWRAIQTAWEKLLQSMIVAPQNNPATTTGKE